MVNLKKIITTVVMATSLLVNLIPVSAQTMDTSFNGADLVDIIVSIPKAMDVAYDLDSNDYIYNSSVTSKGISPARKELTITADTSVTYYNSSSNEDTLTGTLSFGADGVSKWSSVQLLENVTTLDNRDIGIVIDGDTVKYADLYVATINFNINLDWVKTDASLLQWETYTEDDLTYARCLGFADTVNKSTITEISIPNTYNGYEVKSIGNNAFVNCVALKNAIISDGIKEVPNGAFKNCTALNYVELGSCTKINTDAFYGCSSLTYVKIPDTVTTLSPNCFGSSGLKSIEIPKNINSIEDYPCSNCTNLEYVIFNNGNMTKTEIATNSKIDTLEFTPLVTGITGNYNTVDPAFATKNTVKDIYFNKGLSVIADNTFNNFTSLEKIEFPTTLASIGTSFNNCTALTDVEWYQNGILSAILGATFTGCSNLYAISITSGLTSIADNCFSGCSKINTVRYEDEEVYWAGITIGSGNDALVGAENRIYEYSPYTSSIFDH